MNDEQLLQLITQNISAPFPPEISQEKFNDLVYLAITKDKREALWRLAFNYCGKNKDFSLIEDYFIAKRDDYYLVELVHAVQQDMNIMRLVEKVKQTKDKEFIAKLVERGKNDGLLDDSDVERLSLFNE